MVQKPVIAVDLMGGDNAPEANIQGCEMALQEGINLLVLGKKEAVGHFSRRDNVEIKVCEDVIEPEDSPVRSIRQKSDSSLVQGFMAVKEGKAQGIVSGGPTGALVAGGVLLLGRTPSVDKPCISTVLPTKNGRGVLFLDLGAAADVRRETLLQFAYMGSIYAREVMGRVNPKIGLLNIGEERDKGNSTAKDAYKLLEKSPLNFAGNLEARDIFTKDLDVIVTDGFSGNIFLKTCEGVSEFLMGALKEGIQKNFKSKLAGLMLKEVFRNTSKLLDYTQYGGAPLLGLQGSVIKCHGSSNALAVLNGIRQANLFIEKNVSEIISRTLDTILLDGEKS